MKKEDKEDVIGFLEEYLHLFRNKKEHQENHKKERCHKCELAQSLLKRLKN